MRRSSYRSHTICFASIQIGFSNHCKKNNRDGSNPDFLLTWKWWLFSTNFDSEFQVLLPMSDGLKVAVACCHNWATSWLCVQVNPLTSCKWILTRAEATANRTKWFKRQIATAATADLDQLGSPESTWSPGCARYCNVRRKVCENMFYQRHPKQLLDIFEKRKNTLGTAVSISVSPFAGGQSTLIHCPTYHQLQMGHL